MFSTLLITGLLAAAPPGQVRDGRQLFHDPGVGKNGVACATCHSTVRDEARRGDGLLRAGHSLFGVARRPYWRGDRERRMHTDVGDAANVCVQIFQGGRPLEGGDKKALVAFLKTLRKGRRRAAPVQLVTALEADLDYNRPKYRGGDPKAGRGLFYRACHSCHPHGGAGLGPSIAGLSVAEVAKATREGNGLIRGARKGSDWMPAFGQTRLADGQVADIAAYVRSLGGETARK